MAEMQYVVVTIANNGVVHTWGPYDSRREANNAKARMKNRLKRDFPIDWYPEYHEPGAIRYSVCQLNDGTKR